MSVIDCGGKNCGCADCLETEARLHGLNGKDITEAELKMEETLDLLAAYRVCFALVDTGTRTKVMDVVTQLYPSFAGNIRLDFNGYAEGIKRWREKNL